MISKESKFPLLFSMYQSCIQTLK